LYAPQTKLYHDNSITDHTGRAEYAEPLGRYARSCFLSLYIIVSKAGSGSYLAKSDSSSQGCEAYFE